MERLDITVHDVKAGQFKTDDIGARMQALLGDASLAQHSLANEQPLGTACLVSAALMYLHCSRCWSSPAVYSLRVVELL